MVAPTKHNLMPPPAHPSRPLIEHPAADHTKAPRNGAWPPTHSTRCKSSTTQQCGQQMHWQTSTLMHTQCAPTALPGQAHSKINHTKPSPDELLLSVPQLRTDSMMDDMWW